MTTECINYEWGPTIPPKNRRFKKYTYIICHKESGPVTYHVDDFVRLNTNNIAHIIELNDGEGRRPLAQLQHYLTAEDLEPLLEGNDEFNQMDLQPLSQYLFECEGEVEAIYVSDIECHVTVSPNDGNACRLSKDSYIIVGTYNEEDDNITILKPQSASRADKKSPSKKTSANSMESKLNNNKKANTTVLDRLARACEQLQLSSVPQTLIGRDTERLEIYTTLRMSIEQKMSGGGPLYISGLPGVGKTSIVKEIISSLQKETDAGELPYFEWVEINGLHIPKPEVAYSVLWNALDGEAIHQQKNRRQMGVSKLCSALESIFLSKDESTHPILVVLLDEMDYMVAGKSTVLYNLLEWQTYESSKLIIIGIANTMDLPERLPTKIRSRLGGHRIVFPPYTSEQMESILHQRLENLNVFEGDAIRISAKTLAHQSGDIRQAITLCRKAVEVCMERLQSSSSIVLNDEFVTLEDLQKAQQFLTVSAPMNRLRACSKFECIFLIALRMVLKAVANSTTKNLKAPERRSGNFEAVLDRIEVLCKTHSIGLRMPGLHECLCICGELERSGLIRQTFTKTCRYPSLSLRCSNQEIDEAFLDHPVGMMLIS